MVHLLELLHSWLGTLTLPGMGVKISGYLTQVPGQDLSDGVLNQDGSETLHEHHLYME